MTIPKLSESVGTLLVSSPEPPPPAKKEEVAAKPDGGAPAVSNNPFLPGSNQKSAPASDTSFVPSTSQKTAEAPAEAPAEKSLTDKAKDIGHKLWTAIFGEKSDPKMTNGNPFAADSSMRRAKEMGLDL